MRVIDENTVTDAVLEQMSGTADPRLKEVMSQIFPACALISRWRRKRKAPGPAALAPTRRRSPFSVHL
jgi:hypothetical protein